jgi:hypothetical protein
MPLDSQADQVAVEGQFQPLEGVSLTGPGGRNEKFGSGQSMDRLNPEQEAACKGPSGRTYGDRKL